MVFRKGGGEWDKGRWKLNTNYPSDKKVRLDKTNWRIFVGQRPIHLWPKTEMVLAFLLINEDKLITKEEIIKYVWGTLSDEELKRHWKILDIQLSNVRSILKKESAVFEIQCVFKKGYIFKG